MGGISLGEFSSSSFWSCLNIEIAQMGLVSKEIAQFYFFLVCYAPLGLDEVSVITLVHPLNQSTALLGFGEISVTACSTSTGLVQRMCNSVL